MGHIISSEGLRVDPDKISVITTWPTPTTLTQLRTFLGLTGFYRRFVRNYAALATPLTNLLRKEAFQWSPEADAGFSHLKVVMTSTLVLITPDFNQPFQIECDASGFGLGAVLMEDSHPIEFESRKLKDHELHLSTYQKEMKAILHAIDKWRQYLLGSKFTILTDHRSLHNLLTQPVLSKEQAKWVHRLQVFDFSIAYKKGKDNTVADALSRLHPDDNVPNPSLHAINNPQPLWLDELCVENQAQPNYPNWRGNVLTHKGWSTFNNHLLYHNHSFVHPSSSFIPKILTEYHSSPLGGHSSFDKTYRRIRTDFFLPHMKTTIFTFVLECDTCQRNKVETKPLPGLLQPLNIPQGKWQDIAMDFITGLPPSAGFDSIWVIIDRLTKYSHFLPVHTSYSSSRLTDLYVQFISRLHGFPSFIVCDRDPKFTSSFWQELFI